MHGNNLSSTIYLTSLLLADLVLVTVMPFGVISTAYGEWIFGQSVEEKYQVQLFQKKFFLLSKSGVLIYSGHNNLRVAFREVHYIQLTVQ